MATSANDRPTNEPVLIDTEIVATLLGVSERHVARLRDGGLMPQPLRLGRLCKWPRKVIEEWITNGCPAVRNVAK